MAKSSWIARNKRKQATVAKYASLRLKLKKEKDFVLIYEKIVKLLEGLLL
jgi:hypothetical protein